MPQTRVGRNPKTGATTAPGGRGSCVRALGLLLLDGVDLLDRLEHE